MGMVPEAFASYLESRMTEMTEVELGMLPGVLGEIKSMGVKLGHLKNFLPDAERQRSSDKSIQAWVTKLKHAMYGAADIIDLCQLEAMERDSSAADGVGCFNPLLCCMRNPVHVPASRIKGFNQRLDIMIEQSARFNFLRSRNEGRGDWGLRHTSSLYSPLDVAGGLRAVGEKIEEATKALVAEIRQTRKEVNNNIAVVAIVGVGGIGKTTLAQKVFNDEAIQLEFDKKIWLCVTKDFNEAGLLGSIISAAGGDFHRGNTLAELRPILTAALKGKKLLLVMDDVWNHTAWENLLKIPIFNSAAQGSRVLITTRDERVAQGMEAEHPYHRVDKLGPEDAWSLLKNQVIVSEMDELEIDMLKDIGLQIIAKCGGLPLAVKVMGGLLRQRDKLRHDWEMFLDDYSPGYKMPEQINYSMNLSYEQMSPCLKQCFLHYSLLPTNAVFYENDIIGMWISEGFVQGNSQELEESGRGYYDELILLNLIETDARYTSQRVCSMNEVVRAFAQSICTDEALVAHVGETDDTYLSSRRFIRLSLESKGLESDMLVWSLLQQQTSLRTLVSIGQIKLKVGDSLIAFSTLRALHIESSNASVLVESLCELKHLRYLSVAHTDVSSLPESINKMKLLQHINLDGCESLEKLPDSIVKLGLLRYLNLNDTSIIAIPQGFRGLKNLRTLYGFPAHMDGDWCSLEELGSLTQLREIGLKGLDNIAATSFAAKARLGEKVRLTYLKLGCTTRLGDDGLVNEGSGAFQDEENQRIEAVFNELYPPDCLRILDIQGYFGLQLPLWLRTTEGTALQNLVVLTMEDLACCTQLPASLGQLPCLKVLKIKGAPAIRSVGPEFVGVYDPHTYRRTMFCRLHELVFFGMVEWAEWVWENQARAMPVLEELLLDTCKLRSFPSGLAFHARALKRLVINVAPNLNSVDSFASVVELDVYFSPELRSIANLLKLQNLTIVMCPKLRTLIGVPAIRRLVLEDYGMKTLPRYLKDVRNLSLLQLDCSLKLLTSIAVGKSGPEWQKFSHVKHVKAYAHDGDNRRKWYVFYTKDPYELETNIIRPSSRLAAVSKGDRLIGKDEDYILGTDSSSDSAVSEDEDDRELVGIDSPCEDLIKLLMHGDDKQLKMASICGTGGSGKTTIAGAVYRKIGNEFDCKAFVRLPRDPDIKVIIGSIYDEVGCPCPNSEECGVQQLIDQLRIFFQEKRYLIVLDGIWATSVWDRIQPALRENNHGSRIIITTRKVSVAEHVGGLYHLPLLSYNDSKILFFRRTLFGIEDHCPSQFRELSKKMLSRCGQLPLAIIVITDLLPKGMVLKGWQKVWNSIEMGDSMNNIRRVLKHSYDDLPQHLQKCLLYLSIFPKGYKIRTDSLVQRWIVEDLIRGEPGPNLQNLQELGEIYLSELVNSSMIEPIEFDSFGRALAYHVPVTTLDLIVDLSIHENFVTILPSLQRTAQSTKVQRLSLQDSNEQHDVLKATKTIGEVSSLFLFYGADLMQPLSKFQGLHVLDLEKCDSLKNEHLNGLGNLDKLRYLVLGSSHITEIPKNIWKLSHLQTLDLTATGVKELPSIIVKLTTLRRLLINRSTEVPEKIIGKLQALEELVEIDVSKSPNILQEISTVPELRVLNIALWSWDERHTTLLSETMCELTTKKLKHLSIFSCCLLDFKSDIQPVLQQLETLEIQGCIFNKLPNWICNLTHLRSLSIEIYSLENDALRILGKSTHLVFLSLVAKRTPVEKLVKRTPGEELEKRTPGEILVIARDEFRTLKTFLLFNRVMLIKFEKGGMERLQRLKLTLQASLIKKDDLHFGLETLPSLKHVQVEIICFSATDGAVKAAEAAIQSMVGNNPSKPTLEITRTVEKYMTEDKKKEADCEIKAEDEDQDAPDAMKSE